MKQKESTKKVSAKKAAKKTAPKVSKARKEVDDILYLHHKMGHGVDLTVDEAFRLWDYAD